MTTNRLLVLVVCVMGVVLFGPLPISIGEVDDGSSISEAGAGGTASAASRRPRKVLLGTTMWAPQGKPLELSQRLAAIEELIDEVAREAARSRAPRGLDIVVLTEEALTSGAGRTAKERAVELEGAVLTRLGAKARQYNTYLVVTLTLRDDEARGVYTNAAILLDRRGKPVGTYRKVHPVADLHSDILEGGVTPGREFPVFDCDFGRIGIQICWDMAYEDGWQELARQGAEIVALPTASPQTARPASFALRHGYYVVTSTPRNNASIFNPIGKIDAQTTAQRVLVHEIDLSYAIVPWSPELREGKLFREKYGNRVGYTYYESEDAGLFWSNDPQTPIDSMVRQLGLSERGEEVERVRQLQNDRRGGLPIETSSGTAISR